MSVILESCSSSFFPIDASQPYSSYYESAADQENFLETVLKEKEKGNEFLENENEFLENENENEKEKEKENEFLEKEKENEILEKEPKTTVELQLHASSTFQSEYLTQQETILINLLEFYKDETALTKVLKIINGKSKISLRIIDWFVTNFAKQYFTRYNLHDASGNVHFFKVHNEYQCFLDSYKKERFDPFCRWERVFFPYQGDAFIETTIGQLKFFKWAIEKKIIDFVEENYAEIESDMNARNSSSKKQKKNRLPKKAKSNQQGSEENKEDKKDKKDEENEASYTTVCSNLKEWKDTNPTTQEKELPEPGSSLRGNQKTKKRKKREELSVSATKCLKKEQIDIIVRFK